MKIVSIGGGTGQFSLLTGLKEFVDSENLELSAIVTTLDNGGSSGKLITQYGVLPPGDVRNCILALSKETKTLINLFQYRFDEKLDSHNFGNLFLTALTDVTGSFEEAVNVTSRILKIKGKVIPVCLTPNNIVAKLEDGRVIIGETLIDTIKNKKIKQVFLEKPVEPNQRAVTALKEADIVILGPGDLYSSIIPNLLFPEIREAIRNNLNSKKVFVVPVMTKPGETDNYKVSNYKEELEKYLESPLTHLIVNTDIPQTDALEKYSKENKFPVELDEIRNSILITGSYIDRHNLVRHNPLKLAKAIINLKNDM